ncbi:hypothetical protein BDC45DRAFT_493110 [Circinella umbellata]|nr:hypothetical protein BDC45DRAFT_493110 [Circinella umbellata]
MSNSNYTVLSVRILHKDQQQNNNTDISNTDENRQQLATPPPEPHLEQSSGFSNHSDFCVCGGSGIGCDCRRVCHCAEVKKMKCHCGQGCYNAWDRCMLG